MPGLSYCWRTGNYESYNDLAHLEKRGWKYLIRLKDKGRASVSGVTLPETPEFDLPIHLTLGRLTKRQLSQRGIPVPQPYYRIPNSVTFDFLEQDGVGFRTLDFRVVRLRLGNGQMQTLLTNLDAKPFPPEELKPIYAKRWGIETSFRSLKYAVGLIHLHAKKPKLVLQEVYASFIVYNFTQAVTWGVDTDRGCSKAAMSISPRRCICAALSCANRRAICTTHWRKNWFRTGLAGLLQG